MQVDFYILAQSDFAEKHRYACRIANKAFGQGMTVFIATEDAAQSAALDKLLWTFAQNSFVPHAVGDGEAKDRARYPVQIGAGDAPHPFDLLISLRRDAPHDYAQFARVAELIIDDADDKTAGRARFRFYREQGIAPNTHNIS
ncbi:MAG: DNA polymerase III subunit chi [Gammaproteobacteria bacterium]|nr:DNA polymerase III subunit chi [Gammaproteobacteria bacterium]